MILRDNGQDLEGTGMKIWNRSGTGAIGNAGQSYRHVQRMVTDALLTDQIPEFQRILHHVFVGISVRLYPG